MVFLLKILRIICLHLAWAIAIPVVCAAQSFVPAVFSMPDGITPGDYIPGKIVFKMKQGYETSYKSTHIAIDGFQKYLDEIAAKELRKKFPQHSPPVKAIHPSGQEYVDLSRIYQITIPSEDSLEEAINKLYSSNYVEYAQPYYIPHTLVEPDDPFISSQYYLETIQALDAWAVSQGDTTIVIAIVDTGIDLLHPDLIHDIAYNYDDPINEEDSDNDGYVDNFHGWDLGENNNNPQFNANAHGVHVAGVAGASTNNGTGIAGVGYKSRILPVKVSDPDGRMVKAYEGIIYAADQGAQIINCSWGGAMGAGQFGQDIVNYAVLNKDAVVIAAAGNSNNQVRIFPASYANVVSVAATDSNDEKWNNSSYGKLVDISAPGANLLSTWTNGTYISSSGTSLAAPVVAGAAAIVRSHFPDYNALQIAAQLKVTTDIIDTLANNQPYKGLLGTGRLNLYKALTETEHPYILLTGLQHPKEHYQLYSPGETFELGAEFQNLLAETYSISAELSTDNQYIEIVSHQTILGAMGHLETTNNFTEPFSIRLKENIPPSQTVDFTISFFTHNQVFAGKQNFSIIFNLDYVDLISNQLHTTINSRGNIGFNYPEFNQGIGFKYQNANQNQTLLKCGGLVLGSSTSKVVDNIYGAVEKSFSNSFFSLENARIIDNPQLGDFHIKGSFNDSTAGSNRMGLKIDYDIYGFENSPRNKFIILEYRVINTSDINLVGLHGSFFADWTIQDIRNHRAAFDPEHNLGYAFSAGGGNYTGIQVLNHTNIRHYAFDNQGFGGSIKINDGFTSFEKYTAMRNNRDNAGFFDKDNDISTLIGAGPFNLAPRDTITFAFSLLAGDHMMDLQRSAQIAQMVYHGDYVNVRRPETNTSKHTVSPNPFIDKVSIDFYLPKASNVQIFVYDATGKHVYSTPVQLHTQGLQNQVINTQDWKSGNYILQITTDIHTESHVLIKK